MGIRHKTLQEKVAEVADEVIEPLVEPIVINYLEENPPAGGLTIEEIKADTDISDSLTKKHASGSDNQDLSVFENHIATPHLQFSGLAKITVGTTAPSNPQEGDLWIDTTN